MKKLLILSMLAALGVAVHAAQMAQYDFEGNLNDSVGTFHGTTFGTPSYQTGGPEGTSLGLNVLFNNVNYAKLPAGMFNDVIDFSAAVWVKITVASGWQRIFDFGNGTGQYVFLGGDMGFNFRFVIKNNGGEQIVNADPLVANQWYHVVATLEGNTGKLYINGVLAATNTNMTINPGDFDPQVNYIAKSQWPDIEQPTYMDDFRLYNHALTQAEIDAIIGVDVAAPAPSPATWEVAPVEQNGTEITMTATTGVDPSAPVEYYFEETTGHTGGDDSGWQLSPTYTDTGLVPGTMYSYRVQMRDAKGNTGKWSVSKTVLLGYDLSQNQMIANYKFDGDPNDSALIFDGVANGTVEYVNGIFGKAVKLSGDDYIQLPGGMFGTLGDFTISYWVSKDPSTAYWSNVFCFANGFNAFLWQASGGNFEFTNNGVWTENFAAFADSKWIQKVMVKQGTTWVNYQDNGDGKGLVALSTRQGVVQSLGEMNPQINTIGANIATWNDPLFIGLIDDFRVYNYAVTDLRETRPDSFVEIPQDGSSLYPSTQLMLSWRLPDATDPNATGVNADVYFGTSPAGMTKILRSHFIT